MMTTSKGMKVAVLVASGFNENHFLMMQKAMQDMSARVKIISMNQGLVNGWSEEGEMPGWGHNYPVDEQLNSALGADYDALIIPGGQRSMDKMKMTAHTRRFIGSFMMANKPVAVMGDAMDIMNHVQAVEGRTMSMPNEMCQMDGNMMSGMVDEAYMTMMMEMFSQEPLDQAA